jgi:hypothetical protein
MKRKLIRDIAPFGLRMPEELKERLTRESSISGRSLNAEIVFRLTASLDNPPPYAPISNGLREHAERGSNTMEFSDHERQLLAEFRRLSVSKQMALLVLLKVPQS